MPVIRHMVLVRFCDEVNAAAIEALMSDFAALSDMLDGIRAFAHRRNVSPEDHVTHGLAHLFWFDFDDEAARDAYLVAPAHTALGARLVAMADGGVAGLTVCDFVP